MNFLEALYTRLSEEFPDAPDSATGMNVYFSEKDPVLFGCMQEFRMHFETWHFIANDRDLKLKAVDIWRDQKEVFENTLRTSWDELLGVAAERGVNLSGLDPLAEPDWLSAFRKSLPDETEDQAPE